MRPSQCIGNLDGILQSFIQPHPVPGNQPVERLAGDAFHRNKVNTISLADVVNGDDVGVVQRRSRLRFLHEALLTLGVGNLLRREDFDGHLTTEAALDGTVYLTHPSRP